MGEERMDTGTALDLARQYHTRQVQPFARLVEVLEIVQFAEQNRAGIETALAAVKADLRTAQEQAERAKAAAAAIQQEAAKVIAESERAIQRSRAAAAQAEQDANAASRDQGDRLSLERRQIEAETLARLQRLSTEASAKQAELEGLTKAVEALKARFAA